MRWNALSVLQTIFRSPAAAVDPCDRWRRAFAADPQLAQDIAELGGVLSLPAERFEDGVAVPDPICPYRAMREQGERNLAIKLLSLGGVTTEDLNLLMENEHEMD